MQVTPVFWNANVNNQSQLTSFYNALVGSQFVDFLSYEYSTATYPVNIGSAMNAIVGSEATANITDGDIQTFLINLLNSGVLPQPTDQVFLPVYFPPGMTISGPGVGVSCQQLCVCPSYVRACCVCVEI